MKITPLSIILMVHNEEETIGAEVMSYYREIIRKLSGSQLIIAEDGSTDNTRNILYRSAKTIPLTLLVTPEKRGYAKSLRLAISKARGELIFYADAGGKHDPKDFWKLYKETKKYDMVTGYKKKRHDPWYRLLLAYGLNKLINFYFGVCFRDIDCGYKLFNRRVKKILLGYDWLLKNNISLELVLRTVYSGCRVKEIAIKHFKRRFGPSRGIPVRKIPRIVFSLLLVFPKLKKTMLKLKREFQMINRYNKLFATRTYREIWEGKISVLYKLPKYLKIIKTLFDKSDNVLEVGCGDGEIAEILLDDRTYRFKTYTAVEPSEGGFKVAKERLRKFPQAKVITMSGEEMVFKDKNFDTVFAVDVMHHVAEPKSLAREMVRVARKKVFLIEANGLSLARRLAEQQRRYKENNENSYFPWEYRSFFNLERVREISLRPFLFMFPHCPETLIPVNIFISELLEKIPLLKWQCSGVIIEIALRE